MSVIKSTSYSIFINEDWEVLNQWIKGQSYTSIFVLIDENTLQHCLPTFIKALPIDFHLIEIESGEAHKTIETCQIIWQTFLNNQADRQSLMINLGGGVIGDMGGFAAKTYMRGMDYIQIPTTLLAQVDASVGSKLGIDFSGRKNTVGLFASPKMVWIFTDFLKTLDQRQLRSGYAEVIKHALLIGPSRWDQVNRQTNLSAIDWEELIEWNVKFKNEIVTQDEKEKGLRKILNFGHSIGHGIESVFLDNSQHLLHGEAIAFGIILESKWAKNALGLTPEKFEEINNYITNVFELDFSILLNKKESIIDFMKADKKNRAGSFRISSIKEIGKPVFDQEISPEEIALLLN